MMGTKPTEVCAQSAWPEARMAMQVIAAMACARFMSPKMRLAQHGSIHRSKPAGYLRPPLAT
jgi:hypothetical protein